MEEDDVELLLCFDSFVAIGGALIDDADESGEADDVVVVVAEADDARDAVSFESTGAKMSSTRKFSG